MGQVMKAVSVKLLWVRATETYSIWSKREFIGRILEVNIIAEAAGERDLGKRGAKAPLEDRNNHKGGPVWPRSAAAKRNQLEPFSPS